MVLSKFAWKYTWGQAGFPTPGDGWDALAHYAVGAPPAQGCIDRCTLKSVERIYSMREHVKGINKHSSLRPDYYVKDWDQPRRIIDGDINPYPHLPLYYKWLANYPIADPIKIATDECPLKMGITKCFSAGKTSDPLTGQNQECEIAFNHTWQLVGQVLGIPNLQNPITFEDAASLIGELLDELTYDEPKETLYDQIKEQSVTIKYPKGRSTHTETRTYREIFDSLFTLTSAIKGEERAAGASRNILIMTPVQKVFQYLLEARYKKITERDPSCVITDGGDERVEKVEHVQSLLGIATSANQPTMVKSEDLTKYNESQTLMDRIIAIILDHYGKVTNEELTGMIWFICGWIDCKSLKMRGLFIYNDGSREKKAWSEICDLLDKGKLNVESPDLAKQIRIARKFTVGDRLTNLSAMLMGVLNVTSTRMHASCYNFSCDLAVERVLGDKNLMKCDSLIGSDDIGATMTSKVQGEIIPVTTWQQIVKDTMTSMALLGWNISPNKSFWNLGAVMEYNSQAYSDTGKFCELNLVLSGGLAKGQCIRDDLTQLSQFLLVLKGLADKPAVCIFPTLWAIDARRLYGLPRLAKTNAEGLFGDHKRLHGLVKALQINPKMLPFALGGDLPMTDITAGIDELIPKVNGLIRAGFGDFVDMWWEPNEFTTCESTMTVNTYSGRKVLDSSHATPLFDRNVRPGNRNYEKNPSIKEYHEYQGLAKAVIDTVAKSLKIRMKNDSRIAYDVIQTHLRAERGTKISEQRKRKRERAPVDGDESGGADELMEEFGPTEPKITMVVVEEEEPGPSRPIPMEYENQPVGGLIVEEMEES